jgi:hypothetical protein
VISASSYASFIDRFIVKADLIPCQMAAPSR